MKLSVLVLVLVLVLMLIIIFYTCIRKTSLEVRDPFESVRTGLEFRITRSGNTFNTRVPPYPTTNKGRGIVISANKFRFKYVAGLYANVMLVRKYFGCDLPIEIFYVGKEERFDDNYIDLLTKLGNVRILDLTQVLSGLYKKQSKYRGYCSKPLSVIASSFSEVLLLDADSVLFENPEKFFEIPEYKSKGMYLFLDYVTCTTYVKENFLTTLGLTAENYCKQTRDLEIDSSCVVVNKEQYWDILYAISMINVESKTYYANVLGDKDTWLIASNLLGKYPAINADNPNILMVPRYIGNDKKYSIVFGHLQLVDSVPYYYNNQMIDFRKFDGMKDWMYGYYKNPSLSKEIISGDLHPVTDHMKEVFDFSRQSLYDISDILDRLNTGNNMINYKI